jgi:hypothetical protein
LKPLAPKPGRLGIPLEHKRVEIIRGLLNLKHFHGIWYNGFTLSVRRFIGGTGGGDIEYLSWSEAQEMLEVAANLALERKPPQPTTEAVKIFPCVKF